MSNSNLRLDLSISKEPGSSHILILTGNFHHPATMFQRKRSRQDSLEEALPVYTTSSSSPTTSSFPTSTHNSEKKPFISLLAFQFAGIHDISSVDYTGAALERTSLLENRIKSFHQPRFRLFLVLLLGLLIIIIILILLKQYSSEVSKESFGLLWITRVKDSLVAYFQFPQIL